MPATKVQRAFLFLAIITLYRQERWLRKSNPTTVHSLTDFNFSEMLCDGLAIAWRALRALQAGGKGGSSLWPLERGACSEAPAGCLRSGPAPNIYPSPGRAILTGALAALEDLLPCKALFCRSWGAPS